jgi:hypothetical protein
MPKKVLQLNQLNFTFIFFFIVGVIGQLLIIAPSGINIDGNILFWSAHGHDGVWHLNLIEELKKGSPFQNPSFSQQKLINYHFFSDIPISDFSLFFHFSTLDLFFRFFPLLFSCLLGLTS